MNIFNTSKIPFIAHRGFTPLAPENSLPSFYYAGFLGQWATETDLHITRDGEIVCCHNSTIDKYCDGTGKISEMTYAEISRLSIINGNRAECFSRDELKIPLFSEYLAICKKFGSVPFIELKVGDVERIIHALHKNGFADDEVVMSSIIFPWLSETRRYSKDMFLHWIFAEEEKLPELAGLGNAGFSFNIPDAFTCPKEKIDLAHKMGLKVCLRAADTYESLEYMKALGLDYFPTNTMHGKGK